MLSFPVRLATVVHEQKSAQHKFRKEQKTRNFINNRHISRTSQQSTNNIKIQSNSSHCPALHPDGCSVALRKTIRTR